MFDIALPLASVMETLSNPYVLAVICALAVAGLVGFLFRKDTQIENRRKNAIDIATDLSVEGFEELPKMLKLYAVGDYNGIAALLHHWHDLLKNENGRRLFIQNFLHRQLEIAMKDPVKRAEIIKAVEEFKKLESAKEAEVRSKVLAEEEAKRAAEDKLKAQWLAAQSAAPASSVAPAAVE